MYSRIRNNLHRQFKALEVLEMFLDEEFEFLQVRDTDNVTNLEFSIHELLRQIAVERAEIKKQMNGASLKDYAGLLPEEEGREIVRYYKLIDSLEQRCSRQASYNAELSLALMDQSQGLLAFLHSHIMPQAPATYGSGGRIRYERPGAAIISGRM